ncbi:MAG TPA: protein-disulfide reductase DsbD domain-containing protein, partial [Phenylobacterium sp.]|nr:protein-disulfide reductase DsbD domain-containing protein [Phenylobacterium sp.]
MPRLVALIFAILALAGAARAAPVDTGHLLAELVPQTQGIQPGGSTHVALRQQIDKGWHTYWRNAGDSGEPTQIAWTLPVGWRAGDFVWKTPERQPYGPLTNYGYSGEVLLPMKITAPADARPGETVTLKAAVGFLVCAEQCIPEDAVLEIALPVVAAAPPADPKWGAPIQAALDAAPKTADLKASFQRTGGRLTLAVAGAPIAGAQASDAYFFPYDSIVVEHSEPQTIERGPQGLTLSIAQGVAFQNPTPPASLAGVLTLDGKAYEITAAEGPAPAGAAGLGPPAARAGDGGVGLGLPLALGFALLGGLILNLMPCVFPVLAMKAASLAGHGHDERAAKSQGLAFLAGVLVSFVALAAALIAVKAAGGAVGWGFQLQSPPVVAALALLMLLVALNLSGVFEVGTSAQGVGSGLAARGGLAGAFFTGVLAVV